MGNPRKRLANATRAVVLIAVAAGRVFSLSPDRALTQYGHDIWTSQSGLPGEAVYEIASTVNGYLWLRTSNGLVRFDGARFKLIQLTPPFDDSVRAICRSSDGHLLLRGWAKTLLLKGDELSNYLPPALLPNGSPRLLFETSQRRLWLGTDDLVYVYRDGAFTPVISKTGWITAILEDRSGTIWIGTLTGLHAYKNGELLSYQTELHAKLLQPAPWLHAHTMQNSALQGEITALAEDRSGALWVGTRDGLIKMIGGKPVEDPATQSLASKRVSAILTDRDGNLWIGTDSSGLYQVKHGEASLVTIDQGLTDNSILSLYEDREGSVWVGTRSGLDRFRDTKLTTFTTEEGLSHNSTVSVLQAQDGSMYVVSEDGAVTRLKSGIATVYTTRNGMAANYGGPIFESKDGSIWTGSVHGLSRIKDGKVTAYREGLSQIYISSINEDDEGLILATSGTPVLRFKDGRLSPFTIKGQPAAIARPGNYIFTIYRDHTGTVWFGSLKGFYRYGSQDSPAGTNIKQIDFLVFSMYDDLRGNLWLTGATPGLIRFRPVDGTVTKYTTADGLADNEIGRALRDDRGNLWMSTPRGIFSVSVRDLDAFAEHNIRSINSVVYSTADGMRTTEFSGLDHQPAGWKARDGKLWFTTHKGVVVIDPDHIPKNQLAPPVRIEEVISNQTTLRMLPGLELAPNSGSLEIHYTGLSFLIPPRVHFKYTLEGYDSKWIDAGTRRVAFYTKLPPSTYRFRVMACNDDGVWNEEGASWAFSIAPAFYQTTWFRLLCATLALGLAWGIYRLRLRQATTTLNQLYEERLAERTRIARELHDTLLQSLAGVSLQLDAISKQIPSLPAAAAARLKLIRQQLDSSFRETRQKVWDLRSPALETQALPRAMRDSLEQIVSGCRARLNMVVTGRPRPCSREVEEHVLRIGQEAVTNAARHADAAEIRVDLRYEDDQLKLSVLDDGQGFEFDKASRKIGHWGLITMEERASQIGAQLRISSAVGCGTTVEVTVPVLSSE